MDKESCICLDAVTKDLMAVDAADQDAAAPGDTVLKGC